MNNKIRPYIFPAIGIVSLLLSVSLFIFQPGGKKVAYVQMETVYNGFQLKSTLESQLKETEKARQFIIDSLKLQLHQMTLTIQSMEKVDTSMLRLYNLRQQYVNAQEMQFAEDNQALASEYTDQIWGQINQYTRDYGNESGYDYILGASGDGTLMYANETEDITEELKAYINNRFSGGSK
jgi:outer membrane protein